MKAMLVFNLPDERDEHKLALNGVSFYQVLSEIDNQLRTWEKHGNPFKDTGDAVRQIRTLLRDAMEDKQVGFWMVE